MARPGDCVLIAGKGHEDYQIIGDERLPLDDREVARGMALYEAKLEPPMTIARNPQSPNPSIPVPCPPSANSST